MVALGVFQALLDGIGWILASIFDVVGNYGLSILVLTIVIKLVLLPLGVKQIKSMQAMQSIQPKVKELQKKYKGNKAKVQEETMKLYKEAGVNPLGGCLPLLLQFPILIAMYAVLRAPELRPVDVDGRVVPSVEVVDGQRVQSAELDAYTIHNSHLPVDSELFKDVLLHEDLGFLGMNLQCSAAQSGSEAEIEASDREPIWPGTPIRDANNDELLFDATTGTGDIPCGSSSTDKIPYFALLVFMVGTTFYQQRQMQKASPPGAASGQQQAILKIMPLMFGIFGYTFPAGLTVYWTVSNLWQIGQQHVLLKAGHIGPDAMERRIADQRAKTANKPAKPGFMARMQERAEQAQKNRGGGQAPKKPSGGQKSSGGPRSGSGKGPQPKGRRPNTGGTPKSGRRPNTDPRKRGGGSGGQGDGEAGT